MQIQIRVKGQIDERWSEWLDGLTVTHRGNETVLSGAIPDQAALYGLISKLRDLGLPLAAVRVGEDASHARTAGERELQERSLGASSGLALASLVGDAQHGQRNPDDQSKPAHQ